MRLKIKRKISKDDNLSSERIVDLLLNDRQIIDKKIFLNPPHPNNLSFSDFFSKKEMTKFLKRLEEIKKRGEMIVVYTDYDTDGITGGAILWETLHLLGFRVMPYVPHRQYEGYGFSFKGIDNVKQIYNPSLIISVDHGIAADEKITYAKKKGMAVVVSDHHLKPKKIPRDALAIFHNESLSGAGVSYFLAREIFLNFRDNFKKNLRILEKNFLLDYLSLAALGSVADLVPLIGVTRSIVKHGLISFSKIDRYGIKYLLRECGLENKRITPYEIGFMIAPRINAIGRLEHALDALRLFCTTNEIRAKKLAFQLGMKNRERQNMVEEALSDAKNKIENLIKKNGKLPKIIILWSSQWHEGIIGLIAAKIVEEYHRPTIVMSVVNGFVKGSARSINNFDITNFIRSLKEFGIIEAGGHKLAAGFTLDKKKLEVYVHRAENLVDELLNESELEKTITVDISLPLKMNNLSLARNLNNLEPFGMGNSIPTFYTEGELVQAGIFGKKNDHLKIKIKEEGDVFEIVFFNQASNFLNLSRGQRIGVCYNLEVNQWQDKIFVRGNGKFLGKSINH